MKESIDNQIGPEGAQAISESLKINTSLTYLNLGCDGKGYVIKSKENEKEKNEEMNS